MDIGKGLGSDEVQKRLREYGYNEVPEKRVSPIMGIRQKILGHNPLDVGDHHRLGMGPGKIF